MNPSYRQSFYVKRPPLETVSYESLQQPGALLRIKAPSLMGKTCLCKRILSQMGKQGYRTANLTLELIDRQIHLSSLNQFLRWFCFNLGEELGLTNQIDEYWDEEFMGAKVSCTSYLEEYILAAQENPLILCLDKIDLLFSYPSISEDFFGLLRSWYEKARIRPQWQKLRLIIVHTADVSIRLNINQSPFNVGLPIKLGEFDATQVAELARHYGLNNNPNLVKSLMELVGGHPYLLELALSHLNTYPEVSLAEFLATAKGGIYSHHLQEMWLNLQQHPELSTAYKKVIIADEAIELEPIQAYQLHSMGLVKMVGNQIEPRCQLYRDYFHGLFL